MSHSASASSEKVLVQPCEYKTYYQIMSLTQSQLCVIENRWYASVYTNLIIKNNIVMVFCKHGKADVILQRYKTL